MNLRKRRERRSALAAAIRKRLEPESPPAKASKYLHHLDEYQKEHPDMRAILYCRVSTRAHGKEGNKTYKKVLLGEQKKRGIPVVGYHHEVSSGWILNEDRWVLVNAVKQAKRYIAKGKKAVILAPS